MTTRTALETLNLQINSRAVEVTDVLGSPDDVVYGMTLRTSDGKTISIRADLMSRRVDGTSHTNQYVKVAPVLEVFVNTWPISS